MGSTAEENNCTGGKVEGRGKGTHMENLWSHRAAKTTRVCGGALKGRKGGGAGGSKYNELPSVRIPKRRTNRACWPYHE